MWADVVAQIHIPHWSESQAGPLWTLLPGNASKKALENGRYLALGPCVALALVQTESQLSWPFGE